MAKSRRGTGSVYRRGRIWWIKYRVDGRPFQESSHSEKRADAENLLKRRLGEAVTGKFRGLGPERIEMAELFDDVLEDYQINKRRSVRSVESRIRLYLKPTFGKVRAAALSTQSLKAYIVKRRDAGVPDSSINRELAVVSRAFRLAAENDPPKVNRIIHIPRLAEDNTRTGFLEHDAYLRLRNELPDHVRLIYIIGYHTGVRRGELRKIRWTDVDFPGAEIRLAGTITKNKKPRTIPIYGEMRQWLEMAKAERDQLWPDCPWVFARKGRQLDQFSKTWEPACERAGVAGLLFHDLRRSAVRNMERAGIPRNVAMSISGHKTEAVYRRYDIVNKRDLTNAAVRMENYLWPTRIRCQPKSTNRAPQKTQLTPLPPPDPSFVRITKEVRNKPPNPSRPG
jgi:integrase